jgi:hypothetical protein
MADEILTLRDLNRALLARQMLLARAEVAPLEALGRLVALQGQLTKAPYVALWARVKAFQRQDLLAAIHDKRVVRSTLMRGTLHLATAQDVLAFRTTVMPPPDTTLPGGVRPTPEQLAKALDLARAHFAPGPKDFDSIRKVYAREGVEPVRPMAYAARIMLPLVQVNSDNPFGHDPGGEFTLARTWLGREETTEPQPLELARRYLAAFGPATPADFSGWSGLKGAAAIFDALGGELAVFKDERRRTLYDLRDAPRPPGDTPAPPRLLSDFDVAVISHQDRSRIVPPQYAAHMASKNGLIPPTVLIDGFVAGVWRVEARRKTATVLIRLFEKVSAKDRKALEAEARDVARFLEPQAEACVTFEAGSRPSAG